MQYCGQYYEQYYDSSRYQITCYRYDAIHYALFLFFSVWCIHKNLPLSFNLWKSPYRELLFSETMLLLRKSALGCPSIGFIIAQDNSFFYIKLSFIIEKLFCSCLSGLLACWRCLHLSDGRLGLGNAFFCQLVKLCPFCLVPYEFLYVSLEAAALPAHTG